MKLWQKIFIGTLVIFILAFNAGVLYLTVYSYNFNRQRETENSIREQEMIMSTVAGRITSAESFYLGVQNSNERLTAIIRPLAEFYEQQGVLLALYNSNEKLYTNMPEVASDVLELTSENSKTIMEETIVGRRHVIVASSIPNYRHLTFIYARDISQTDDFRTNISRVFAVVNIIVLIFLGTSIYLLLRHITKPITQLTAITADIANGAYNKRVIVGSNDEIGELAGSFNKMADSIEEQIAELKKSSEEKKQFIDNLTHEIKTPMTSILGYSEFLHSAKATEEEQIIASAHLHETALRLENLSDKLLDLAYSRDENIDKETVYISELFKELTMIMYPKLIPRSIELLTEPLPELPFIIGDKFLLLLMLQNLSENAAKASGDGAVITIRAYMDEHPVIEVTDTGCGMEKRDVERVMAPFYRVDKSRSRKFGGVGLGLSIVSQIADLHNARIKIDSKQGRGTSVKIHFTTF